MFTGNTHSVSHDPLPRFPSVYKQLMARHDYWVSQGIDRLNPGGPDDPRMCQKVEEVGWWVPYQD